MHLTLLFKPLTHPLARGEKSQQIELKLSKKKCAQGEFTEEQKKQGEIACKKRQSQNRPFCMNQGNLGATDTYKRLDEMCSWKR